MDGRGAPRGNLEVGGPSQGTGGVKALSGGHLGTQGTVRRPVWWAGQGVREVTEQDLGGTLALSSSGIGPMDGVTGSDRSRLLCGNWATGGSVGGPLQRLWCHPGQSPGTGTWVVAGAVRRRGPTLRGGK